MKLDKSGLVMVAAAAAVLLLVVRKSTATAAPTTSGNAAPGANNASFMSQFIAAATGAAPTSGSSMATGGQYTWNPMDFVQQFANGTTLAPNGVADIQGVPVANLSDGTIYPGAGVGQYGYGLSYGYGGFGS